MAKEMSGDKKATATKTIKKILISQARPESEKSPYFDLERKYNVTLFFKPFIELEPIGAKEFRKTKIDVAAYTAVIFTSKNAIDHFFAQPQAMSSSPIISVKPGEQIGLNLELSIALDEMQTFVVDGRSLLVPILVASLSDASGELARVTCMVGREATPPQPKMGPLRLDQGPRSFDRLGQRALVS